MVDEEDILALQLVYPAFALGDIFHQRGSLAPIGGGQIEDPLEDRAVGGGGATVAHREDGNLVDRGLWNDLVGNAGRERLVDEPAGRAFALSLLVALDALLRVVLGFALDDLELRAIARLDAKSAVALIQHGEIVGIAVRERNPIRGIGAGAEVERRDHQLVGAGRSGRHHGGYRGQRSRFHQFTGRHCISSVIESRSSLACRRSVRPCVPFA